MHQAQVLKKVETDSKFFTFRCNAPILKYKIEVEPQIPPNQIGLFYNVISKLREKLSETLKTYHFSNLIIYSPNSVDEAVFNVEIENINYIVKVFPFGILNIELKDKESWRFMREFVKMIQNHIHPKPIERKYFDKKACWELSDWKINEWPSYKIVYNNSQNSVPININTCLNHFSGKSVYDLIQDRLSVHKGSQEKVKKEISGMIVKTRVDDIDFGKNP